MSEDIGPILREWDADPDAGSVRKIVDSDGREKLQIRIQFGMLQLEADGRPDGKRPYGKESFLEHYLALMEGFTEEYGTDEGFELDHYDCEKLHEEAIQYYHRYVSLFELGDYERVQRDTARNLQALDLIGEYAGSQEDTDSLERYRPYITMMNARAKSYILMDDDNYAGAISSINEAIDSITEFYKENGVNDEDMEKSQELAILKATTKEIRSKWEGE